MRLDASAVFKGERIPEEFLFFSPGWKAKRTGGGWKWRMMAAATDRDPLTHQQEVMTDGQAALIFFIYGVPTWRCYLLGGLGGPLSISPGPSRLFSQCPPFLHSVTGTPQTQMSPY